MLRRIEGEIPEELKGLVANEDTNRKIVLGDKLYEMATMTLSEVEHIKSIITEIFKEAAKSAKVDFSKVTEHLVHSGLFNEILASMHGLSDDDVAAITIPQLIYAAEAWVDVNFLAIPQASREKLLAMASYFVFTIAQQSQLPEEEEEEPTAIPEASAEATTEE